MSSWDYYPKEFSSYEEYIKYLKEQGLAIEALWKIYLQEPTKVRTERLYNNDIEYVQTDAFIEKACEWLKDALMSDEGGFPITSNGVKEFIKDFKKAMEE